MQKVLVDTNVLLREKFCLSDYSLVIIPITVIEELDNLKHHETKGHLARQAIRNIKQADNIEIKYKFSNGKVYEFLECKNDNRILGMAYEVCQLDSEAKFLTDDYALFLKGSALDIPCQMFEYEDKRSNKYKGYQELSLDTELINKLFTDVSKGINDYNFLMNEYLILHNTDLKDTYEYRFNGSGFSELKLPSSKVIKGRNSLQRCALDLLNNKDIPIKIVAGGFGTGKTLSSVKVGLYHVMDKGTYKNITFLRNPIVTDGTDIGFLPGDKASKIYDFCRPFLQYVESEKDQFYSENLIKNEKIKMDVVSYLKGVSIEDSYVIMDEAEDLNTKLIKLVGSRIGEKSCIVFTGDWNQSENKYKNDNGLIKLIQESKGNPLVGIVVLEEDLRSPASRVFAELK